MWTFIGENIIIYDIVEIEKEAFYNNSKNNAQHSAHVHLNFQGNNIKATFFKLQ